MLISKVLSFIGDLRFNVRGEQEPGCISRGRGGGLVAQGTFSSSNCFTLTTAGGQFVVYRA